MPITYRIDEEKKRIYSRATGVIGYEDMRQHMNAEAGNPAASYGEIIDCSGATTSLTGDDIRSLALERGAIATRQEPAPVAIVATTDLFYGMMRIFDVHTSKIRPLGIFRRIEDAEEWLDALD